MIAFVALAGCIGSADTDTAPTGDGTDTDAIHAVCTRWNADRAALTEGTWSGSAATCDPGTLSSDARESALRLVNLYRFVGGLPPVTEGENLEAGVQACSLMMQANGSLSHSPPSSWSCYSSEGAATAGVSNIASGPAVMAIDMYMADFGNETTMGHRRWLLSNSLGPIGIGGTSGFSCLQVIGGSGAADKAWQAWPPDGPMPIQAMSNSFVPVDQAGWTVQSDAYDLSAASVAVTRDDGQDMPVTTSVLAQGYGSASALRFVPNGWTSEAGHTYHVVVSGSTTSIAWDSQMVDCSTDP